MNDKLSEQEFNRLCSMAGDDRPARAELEPYRVDNAVIMAAGMSSRFVPLSYEKPKGLLKVKGEILIERQIRQLKEAGIDDITVVIGYMKEKFFYLEDKFGVKLVINDDYYRYNNTSTLMCVLDRLSNTYICSSDNYFADNVFEKYVYRAYYSAVYAADATSEYCLECYDDGLIRRVDRDGGSNAWYMLGHAYFDKSFSGRFAAILRSEYAKPETKQMLWEDLYALHVEELPMYIKKYDSDKVLEFDSLEELRQFDSEYINNADSGIMKNICGALNCEIKDIIDVRAIKAGITNTSFSFTVYGGQYVYRHPGRGTQNYINRRSEAFSMRIASELGLDDTFICMNEDEGWKLSRYIDNARELDYHNPDEVSAALGMMRKLHRVGITSQYDFDIWKRAMEFADMLRSMGKSDFEEFQVLLDAVGKVYELVSGDNHVKCLCHCDCYSPNFILDADNKMYLIDWEYSGNDDPASDVGTFICCSDYDMDQSVEVIRQYMGYCAGGRELGHFTGYVAIASYYWYLWALYQESIGKSVGGYLYIWYSNTKRFVNKTMELYGEESYRFLREDMKK